MAKNQHVIPKSDGWAVKREGNSRATSIHDTQASAIQAARKAAKKQGVELIIHGRDGAVKSRDSQGIDRFTPPRSLPSGPGDSSAESPKSRITARVNVSVQEVLADAAAILGVPLNSFIVTAAVEKASSLLAAERRVKLGPEDAKFLERLLENPPEPAPALRAAVAKHREILRARKS